MEEEQKDSLADVKKEKLKISRDEAGVGIEKVSLKLPNYMKSTLAKTKKEKLLDLIPRRKSKSTDKVYNAMIF